MKHIFQNLPHTFKFYWVSNFLLNQQTELTAPNGQRLVTGITVQQGSYYQRYNEQQFIMKPHFNYTILPLKEDIGINALNKY